VAQNLQDRQIGFERVSLTLWNGSFSNQLLAVSQPITSLFFPAILPIGVDVRVARRREMHHIGIIESLSLNRQAIFSMPDFSLAVLVPVGCSVSDDRFRLDLRSVPSTWNGSDLTDRIPQTFTADERKPHGSVGGGLRWRRKTEILSGCR
jgi:hypothetical protein